VATTLTHVIKFVADMDKAVQFHVDRLGLLLRFQSPEWSEFDTGMTTLALHAASAENPAGTCQLGLSVPDLQQFYAGAASKGVRFTSPPTELHGRRIARLRDIDGAETSVSGP
jgi:catechol 2,3-dioxygenase-like lactoylglutathione lyase family enzyme